MDKLLSRDVSNADYLKFLKIPVVANILVTFGQKKRHLSVSH